MTRRRFRLQEYMPAGRFWDLAISMTHAWSRLGYLPRLHAPRTLNEHILSQKLHFRSDLELARQVTDKNLFKSWLQQQGMEELVVPTQCLISTVDEAAGARFSRHAAVKPTHSSGDVMIITGRSSGRFLPDEVGTIAAWLKSDYYLRSREINYRLLSKAVIVEDLLVMADGSLPNDYKIFCICGKPFLIQVDLDRNGDTHRQLFDKDWNLLPYSQNVKKFPRKDEPMPMPPALPAALRYACRLSSHFYLCRIDFYFLGTDKIKVGEVTFFPGNGASAFCPQSGDFAAGELLASAARQSLPDDPR